jgi:hypothetical protein
MAEQNHSLHDQETREEEAQSQLGAVAHLQSQLLRRHQEDCGSKPARENNSQNPILKKPITKKGWWSGLRYRP